MYSNLLELVNTKHEAVVLANEADLLLQSLYEEKGEGFENAMATKVRVKVADAIRLAFSEGRQAKEFLEGLKKELETLPEAVLIVSFDVSQSVADKFAAEITKDAKKKVLVKLRVDRSLIGGAVVEFEGKRGDYSVKKSLTK